MLTEERLVELEEKYQPNYTFEIFHLKWSPEEEVFDEVSRDVVCSSQEEFDAAIAAAKDNRQRVRYQRRLAPASLVLELLAEIRRLQKCV